MFLTSPDLENISSINHAFFTRQGGVSKGIYASLNGGTGSKDEWENIRKNRFLMAEVMKVSEDHFLSLYQYHSKSVITVKAPWPYNARPHADGMVTNVPGIALTIATADCGPVLFADSHNGVIGAAHAGWKGAKQGIIREILQEMEALGAEKSHIIAVLGPTITQKSYEVTSEFFYSFIEQDPFTTQFFKASDKGGHFLFDLPQYILRQLKDAGIQKSSFIGHCTYSEPELFYSYRRASHFQESDYGRLISSICLL